MVIFRNISKKIISVNGIAVMPGDSTEIQDDNYAQLPSIKAMEEAGRVVIVTQAKEKPPVKKPVKVQEEPEEPEEEAEEVTEAVEEPAEEPAEEPKKKNTRKRTAKKAEPEEDPKAVEEELAKRVFG